MRCCDADSGPGPLLEPAAPSSVELRGREGGGERGREGGRGEERGGGREGHEGGGGVIERK